MRAATSRAGGNREREREGKLPVDYSRVPAGHLCRVGLCYVMLRVGLCYVMLRVGLCYVMLRDVLCYVMLGVGSGSVPRHEHKPPHLNLPDKLCLFPCLHHPR